MEKCTKREAFYNALIVFKSKHSFVLVSDTMGIFQVLNLDFLQQMGPTA